MREKTLTGTSTKIIRKVITRISEMSQGTLLKLLKPLKERPLMLKTIQSRGMLRAVPMRGWKILSTAFSSKPNRSMAY